MRLALTQFLTLDGVSQGPGDPTEDTSDGFTRGGWLVPHADEAFVQQASDWLDHADGLLLGRRTYDAFARDWPAITDPDDPFAGRMNALPKYVATRTLEAADWHPSTILRGDAVVEVARLLERPGRELQIHGSARLGATLLAAGLVDVLRLVVAPTLLGDGRRLFGGRATPGGFRVVEHRLTPAGLLLLEYESVGAGAIGTFPGTGALA